MDALAAPTVHAFPDSCLRPMTPDGPPIVGRGRYRNLYYDTGHGHMGFTMSCGTARIGRVRPGPKSVLPSLRPSSRVRIPTA